MHLIKSKCYCSSLWRSNTNIFKFKLNVYSCRGETRRITPKLFRTNRSSCAHCAFIVHLVLRLHSVSAHRSPFKIVHPVLSSVCPQFTHSALCVRSSFADISFVCRSDIDWIFNFEILNDFMLKFLNQHPYKLMGYFSFTHNDIYIVILCFTVRPLGLAQQVIINELWWINKNKCSDVK